MNSRKIVTVIIAFALALVGATSIAFASPSAAAETSPSHTVTPSLLGQDGQVWNRLNNTSIGLITSLSAPGDYQRTLPGTRWSSGYPTYITDVDGYYIPAKYKANIYTCEPSDCLNDSIGGVTSWHYIGQVNAGRHSIPGGFARYRVDAWKYYAKTTSSANAAIPAALTTDNQPAVNLRPGFWTGLGADLYNAGPTTITIQHWWDDFPNYVAYLPVGHWSDEFWQNNQGVYAPAGRGYGLYQATYKNGILTWAPVSAGRGPTRLHLTKWVQYMIRTWA